MTPPRPPARSERTPPPVPGNGPQGDDRLTRWRRRVRAKLLTWMPLGAWKGLFGLLLIILAAVLRKFGVIRDQGFMIMATLGFGLWGYDLTLRQANGVRAARKDEKGEGK